MLFKFEDGSDIEDAPKPDIAAEEVDKEDDPESDQESDQEEKPAKHSSSAVSAPSHSLRPQAQQRTLAFTYNTGLSWERNSEVEKKMQDVLKKSKEKKSGANGLLSSLK